MHRHSLVLLFFFTALLSNKSWAIEVKKTKNSPAEKQNSVYKKVAGTFLLKKIKKETDGYSLEFFHQKKNDEIQTILIKSNNVHIGLQEKKEYALEADVQMSQQTPGLVHAIQIMVILYRKKDRIPIWIAASDRKILDLRHSNISFLSMHHEDFHIF